MTKLDITSFEMNKSKGLYPGTIEAQLISMRFLETGFSKPEDPAYQIILELVTKSPFIGFEGFNKVYEQPSAGKWDGRYGYVSISKYAMKNETTRSGKQITASYIAMRYMRDLLTSFGCIEYWNNNFRRFETFDAFFEQLVKDAPYKDCFLHWAVGGKEYMAKTGKKRWELFLLKNEIGKMPFSADPSKLTVFDRNQPAHYLKLPETSIANESTAIVDTPIASQNPISVSDKAENDDLPF